MSFRFSLVYWKACLAVSVALVLLACGGEASAPVPEAAAAKPISVDDPAEIPVASPRELPFVSEDAPSDLYLLHQRVTGDLDEMVERRYLRALVVYGKTSFFDDRGHPKGITFEAMREFETFLNRKLKTGRLRVHVVFVPVAREGLLASIQAGLGDIAAANLTITPEREKVVDFSTPAMENLSEIVVTGPSAPELASLEDLAGEQVYVRDSSSYYEHLRELSASFRQSGKPPIQIVAGDEHLEDEDILEMVNAGLIGITVVDRHKAELWAQVFDGIETHPEIAVNSGGSVAWAFRKDSPKLEELVNEFLATRKAGTSFGNTLIRRYYKSTRFVKNSVSEKEMAKFNAVIELLRKYSTQYDFDWLMVAAQGYQESRLDNKARNPSGAVGLMQVLPSTAGAPPISIQNVHELENNIHAGVKILRHYRDRYFDDPEIDEENRTLLAFAGYNAGPSRINRLRKKAAGQGLDPNIWFDNVERVVARSVGREPVQYVANVYKYYLAYKLVDEITKSKSRPAER